ncbi:MAG: NACHT domain-containing protein [Chloroflexi bacterium]|nr:NACHT domain-containing protein [Chloroflexota bacterium]
MRDLADILAKLYPDHDRVRLFLLRVGLDPDQINLEGDATLRWERVLDEAWKHQKISEIVTGASQDYEARGTELTTAMQGYLDSRNWRAGQESAMPFPPWVAFPSLRYEFDQWFPHLHWVLTHLGVLPMPPEWTEINDYLRDLRAHIRNEFREKTYLPLAGKPLPSVGPVAREIDKDPFVSPIHQVVLQIMGRSYGGDSASAQIAAASRQSRVVRNILKHLDHTQTPLILLGEPGSGKTMTLQQAAMLLAKRESRRVFPRVPIYVRLGEFYVEGKVDEGDVWEYVKQSVPSSIQRRINELERDGRLAIFFDGMDEMSRERYGEHTEALSVFADWTVSKTLFSCRITDFSPRFLHQRLVILPFDRDQVAEYLDKYIEHFPVLVDGRPWTLKELTKHIVQGELPIEANNPFVLWLLCLYLQDKGSWPGSRVEMLRYYNERNHQRKNEERPADEHPFPKMERTFQEWARFAYLITERNRGPAIPVSLLQVDQDAATVQEMIQVGKRCGVLAESREKHEEYLIRLEHHRFQEFFTALYIHENRPPISWLDKLDAPRWQETMLNLILIGEAGDIVRTFANSVIALTQTCQSEIVEIQRLQEEYKRQKEEKEKASGSSESGGQSNQSGSQEELKKPELVLTDEHETVLADRAEVASRIMRQASAGASDVRETLMPPFREAVSLLADYGNPITQVKMMRACQNVPEIDFIEALRKPLNSSVNWVRNQALLLIAGSQASARASGTDLATEIGYDLASGLFPKRLSAYLKAARTYGDSGHWWSLLAGSCCYLAYLILLLAAAGMLYLGMWSLGDATWFGLPDFSSLNHPISIVTFGIGLTIATVAALRIEPSVLWLAILASAIGLVVLIPVLFALWNGSWVELVILPLALLFFGYFFVYGVSMLIAAPIHFSTLTIYLTVTMHMRRHGHAFKTFLIGAWKVGSFSGTGLLAALGYALFWLWGWWVNYLMPGSAHPLLAGTVAVWVLFIAGYIVYGIGYGFVALIRACKKTGWAKSFGTLLLASLGIGECFLLLNYFLHNWIVAIIGAISIVMVIGLVMYAWVKKGLVFILKGIGAALLVGAGIGIIGLLGLLLNGLLHLQQNPFITGFAAILYIAMIGGGGLYVYREWAKGSILKTVGWMLLFGLGIGVLVGVYILWPQVGSLVAQTCAVSIWLILVVLLFTILRPWVTFLRLSFFGVQKFPPGSFTPESWKKSIEKADGDRQERLLLRTDHQSLSLTAGQFLGVLKEVQPMIKQEPALSTYWEQRDRLGEALRQERQG